MHPEEIANQAQIAPPLNAGIGMAMQADCVKEDRMSLKKHKRLTELAYRVKDFIDGNGGLNYEESCAFGQIMQNIINLK